MLVSVSHMSNGQMSWKILPETPAEAKVASQKDEYCEAPPQIKTKPTDTAILPLLSSNRS
jgi:hypothetical protein